MAVKLVVIKLDEDRGIDLVVVDPDQGGEMIVGLPDVACAGATESIKRAEMGSARDSLTVN